MTLDSFGQLIFFIGVLFELAVIKLLSNFLIELVIVQLVHSSADSFIAGFQIADGAVVVLNFVLVAFFESFLEPLSYPLVFDAEAIKTV